MGQFGVPGVVLEGLPRMSFAPSPLITAMKRRAWQRRALLSALAVLALVGRSVAGLICARPEAQPDSARPYLLA